MTIPTKDTKILWSRAIGRCSICRLRLVTGASTTSTSQATLIGEECHIVGESPDGPRGQSILELKDRNRYPNLILLCRNHHKIIDDDCGVYPIERLHQIKADHELWAESLVGDSCSDELNRVYANLVNSATDGLFLHNWANITDNAIRDLVQEEFVDGARGFVINVTKAIWPGTYPFLEAALMNLSNRVEAYIEEYVRLAYLDDNGLYRLDKRWARHWVDDYDERIQQIKKWERNCFLALSNVTVALNEFAAAVRKSINPLYFFHEGLFFMSDAMGVTNRMAPVLYFPDEYRN